MVAYPILLSTNLSSSTMTSVRGKSFSNQEDQFLCLAWLEISQDSVSGTCQKKDKMWERSTAVFHEKVGDRQRTPKSLECRMDAIKKAANKFRGCVRQIERLNPSGASEIDIVSIYFYYGFYNIIFNCLIFFVCNFVR